MKYARISLGVGLLVAASLFTTAYAASGVTLAGHVRLVGNLQTGGRGTTYAGPTIFKISSGTPGVTSVRITWKTNVPATSEVVYGLTSSYGYATSSTALVGAHSMTILGLTASSTYHYAVVSTDASNHTSTSTDGTFSTQSWPGIGFNSGGAGYYFNNFAFLSNADLAYLKSQGVSTLRTMICWEEMQPTLNEPLNSTYLSNLESYMSFAAANNIKLIIDIHGYARYQSTGAVDGSNNLIGNPANCLANSTGYTIGSAQVPISAFANLWSQLATALAGQPGLGGYEIMNEPHDLGNLTTWPAAAESAIGAIRAVDATTTIYVDGNAWSTDTSYAANNPNFPLMNADDTNLAYVGHAYFDYGGGGNYALTYNQYGAYTNVAVDQLKPFVGWAQQNHVTAAITEFGAPYNDPQWVRVMKNAMAYLKSQNVIGMVHYYDTHQSQYASYWPLQNGLGVQYLNAAPINADGTLNATGTNPLMTLVSQFDLGQL